MMGERMHVPGAVLLLLTLAVSTLQAELPPGTAVIVNGIQGKEATTKQLLALGKNAFPEMADKIPEGVEKIVQLTGVVLGRAVTKGVAKEGPWFEILTGRGTLLPITKYSEFRDGFLTPEERKTVRVDPTGYEAVFLTLYTYLVDCKNGYVLVTQNRQMAVDYAQMTDADKNKLTTELKQLVAKRLKTAHSGFFIDLIPWRAPGNIVKIVLQTLRSSEDLDRNSSALVRRLAAGAEQLLADGKLLVGKVEVRPNGLNVGLELDAEANSKTIDAVKESRPGGPLPREDQRRQD